MEGRTGAEEERETVRARGSALQTSTSRTRGRAMEIVLESASNRACYSVLMAGRAMLAGEWCRRGGYTR